MNLYNFLKLQKETISLLEEIEHGPTVISELQTLIDKHNQIWKIFKKNYVRWARLRDIVALESLAKKVQQLYAYTNSDWKAIQDEIIKSKTKGETEDIKIDEITENIKDILKVIPNKLEAAAEYLDDWEGFEEPEQIDYALESLHSIIKLFLMVENDEV